MTRESVLALLCGRPEQTSSLGSGKDFNEMFLAIFTKEAEVS